MKKLVAILLIAAFAIPAFANDAIVLPAGVIRARVIPTYAFGDQGFNADGDKVDSTEVKLFNLGLAFEYGINDWMTAGLQWAPGWNFWSETNSTALDALNGSVVVNGLADMNLGVAIQIVGPKAPVVSETFRFAVTPAVIIPLPGTDGEKQAADLAAATVIVMGGGTPEAFKLTSDIDKHAWAIGGRVSGDYVLNDMFFFNLCGEFTKYFERKDVYLSPFAATKGDVAYGYNLKLEFEPHFAYDLGNSSNISAGLPVTYEMDPETEVNGVGQANESYTLSITPAVSYFFLAGPLPMELTAQYGMPLMGKNIDSALNSVTLQIKTFIKF